jgi:putative transposase
MHGAYEFLLRPAVRQVQALTEMLRDHGSLGHGALREQQDARMPALPGGIRS